MQKFVVPGTTREAIIARFGQPFSVDKNPNFAVGIDANEVMDFVLLPPHQKMKNETAGFAGFQVWLKDGKAVRWLPHRSG